MGKGILLMLIVGVFLISQVYGLIIYSDLDYGERVFYQSSDEGKPGVFYDSELIGVYDPYTNQCRLPNSCELNEGNYVPMTCLE